MRIEGFSNSIYSSTSPVKVENEQVSGSFGNTVRKAILEVNRLQQEADQLVNKLASGEDVELHQAMIAMQKASTALQFTIQVRNKIIEAYQEIMRMQV